MNIVTAPLWFLLELTSDNDDDYEPARDGPWKPSPATGIFGAFVGMATIISLLVIGGGGYFIFQGNKGATTMSALGLELKTDTVGLAMVTLGLIFYLFIGRMILKAMKG